MVQYVFLYVSNSITGYYHSYIYYLFSVYLDSFGLVRYEMSTGNPFSCGVENILLQQLEWSWSVNPLLQTWPKAAASALCMLSVLPLGGRNCAHLCLSFLRVSDIYYKSTQAVTDNDKKGVLVFSPKSPIFAAE